MVAGDVPGARLVCVEGFSDGELAAKRTVELRESQRVPRMSFLGG